MEVDEISLMLLGPLRNNVQATMIAADIVARDVMQAQIIFKVHPIQLQLTHHFQVVQHLIIEHLSIHHIPQPTIHAIKFLLQIGNNNPPMSQLINHHKLGISLKQFHPFPNGIQPALMDNSHKCETPINAMEDFDIF